MVKEIDRKKENGKRRSRNKDEDRVNVFRVRRKLLFHSEMTFKKHGKI